MDTLVRADLKAVLHLIIDQEAQPLIDEAKAKISNASALAVVSLLEASLLPSGIAAADKAVDAALA
jgi:hypothetical protein